MNVEHNTDLIPLKVHGVLVDPNTDTQIVILRDDSNADVLPIWVGTAEGTSIRLALEGMVPPRPMSHDLITSMTDHLGVKVAHVVVTDVKNNTYYATIHLTSNDVERTVIGDKGIAKGIVEVKHRKTGEVEQVEPKNIAAYFQEHLQGYI